MVIKVLLGSLTVFNLGFDTLSEKEDDLITILLFIINIASLKETFSIAKFSFCFFGVTILDLIGQ